MYSEPTTQSKKHHIDITQETANTLKLLKKTGDTYNDVIQYLIKQTSKHQKCIKKKNKKGNKN